MVERRQKNPRNVVIKQLKQNFPCAPLQDSKGHPRVDHCRQALVTGGTRKFGFNGLKMTCRLPPFGENYPHRPRQALKNLGPDPL